MVDARVEVETLGHDVGALLALCGPTLRRSLLGLVVLQYAGEEVAVVSGGGATASLASDRRCGTKSGCDQASRWVHSPSIERHMPVGFVLARAGGKRWERTLS